VRFSGFGRGIDQDGDGEITNQEGVSAPTQPHPKASVALRDGLRQTAADVMALVRAIGRGVDVDGDGTVDLAPDGVSLYAQSLGGIYGTMVMGVDPDVQVSVLNVPGGPILDIARLSPVFRQEVANALRDRQPCLLNGGRNGFEESLPLYLDPPVTEPVDGAVAIQDVMARTNWINRPGSPETFAPLLRTRPLADSQTKDVIYQFAFGDQVVPNPTSATIARAGDLFERVSYYRNDLTATRDTDPHGFLLDPRLQGRNQGQQQVVDFITSEGEQITDPDGPAPTWEVPIAEPEMLEQLNFDEALYEKPTPAPEGCGVAAAEAVQPAPARDEGSDGTAGAPLPATGGGTATSLLGVALLAAAGLAARRRRSLPRTAR
jgi:LPXTG-motif cell wall-anchored protein